jgi:hypothetical protein
MAVVAPDSAPLTRIITGPSWLAANEVVGRRNAAFPPPALGDQGEVGRRHDPR